MVLQQALQGRPLTVPSFVITLARKVLSAYARAMRCPALTKHAARKVLAGDTDAAALLGTPFDEILASTPLEEYYSPPLKKSTNSTGAHALTPPTAIKAEPWTPDPWHETLDPGPWTLDPDPRLGARP
eukprot:2990116-Rhodomonas_salina.1